MFSIIELFKKCFAFVPKVVKWLSSLNRITHSYLSVALFTMTVFCSFISFYIYTNYYNKAQISNIMFFETLLSDKMIEYLKTCSPVEDRNNIISIMQCNYSEHESRCNTYKVFRWDKVIDKDKQYDKIVEAKLTFPSLKKYHKEIYSQEFAYKLQYNLEHKKTCFDVLTTQQHFKDIENVLLEESVSHIRDCIIFCNKEKKYCMFFVHSILKGGYSLCSVSDDEQFVAVLQGLYKKHTVE